MPIPGESKKTARKKGDLNALAHDYLNYYEKGKKTQAENDQKTMDIVEKMLIHSWIITLEPDLRKVKEFLPGDAAATVDSVNDNIVKGLKDIGKVDVENALFRYKKDLSSAVDNEITKETINKLSRGQGTKQLEDAHAFHEFSERMYVQSYVMVFAAASSDDTIPINFLSDDRAEEQTDVAEYRVTDWGRFYSELDDDSSEDADLDLSD